MDYFLRHHRRRCLRVFLFLFLAGALLVGTMAEERRNLAGVLPSSRKRLQLIGSSPPACRGHCGGCAPCRAVLVVIHPGRVPPENYYPQVWRCECHHKLFRS